MKTYQPDYLEPPGTFIREELEARGWSQSDLSYILGMSASSITAVLTNKRGISIAMAKALGQAFGVSPELFTNLQSAYDLANAVEPDPGIKTRGRIQDHYPLREMVKREWIEGRDPSNVEAELAEFFNVDSPDEIPYLAHAAKRTADYGNATAPQLAWLFRVKHIANEMVTPAYTNKKLNDTVTELLKLRSEPEGARQVPKLLYDSGVRFVVVESLKGGKIDGVCFWIDDTPVIGMSLRYDRIDNFWFVLRHEIEHVLQGHGKSKDVIDVELDQFDTDIPDEEIIANKAASDFCVPQDKMNAFFLRKKPYISERDVIAFSMMMQVHPGIVVGQLQYRLKRWNYLRDHQVHIRQHVTSTAIIDGWGDVAPIGH